MTKHTTFIFLLIIIQPFIDLVTSLSNNMFSISIGALLRTLFMSSLLLSTCWYLFKNNDKKIWLYAAALLTIALTFMINLFLKQPFHLFVEVNFALKTSYYVVMIYTVTIILENKLIQQALIYRGAKIIALIIGSSYWLAVVTKTSIGSYTYEKVGYSGWFYAANELSVTVLILLALTIINLRFEQTTTAWIGLILMMSMIPMIGTKTAFAGGFVILLVYTAYLLLSLSKAQLNIHWPFFIAVVIFLCLIPFSPMATNTETLNIQSPEKDAPFPEEMLDNQSTVSTRILSSRNLYFEQKKEDFNQAPKIRKAFGLGYAGDYSKNPKVIEMDFFDLFFSYGIIGSILLLSPLILLCKKLITFPLHIEKVILLLTSGLCLGISLLAGHVLFAPSVMTYVALLFLALGLPMPKQSWRMSDA